MYEKIKHAVEAHLNKHRLVFWYDEGGKHRAVIDDLQTPAAVLEIENSEWWIKHHVLIERPKDHFLIYAPYRRPDDRENWLLDLVLAGFPFSHDLSETYREELGLSTAFRAFIADHVEFFQNGRERFEPLAQMIDPATETIESLSVKMIGVLTAADAESRRLPQPFGRSLFLLIEEALSGGSRLWDSVEKYGLSDAFRRELRRLVSVSTVDLTPTGAGIALLREAWTFERDERPTSEARSARVLLQQWRDEYSRDDRYPAFVKAGEKALSIRSEIEVLGLERLTRLELFPVVDSVIAERLVADAAAQWFDWAHIRSVASRRRDTYWVRTSMPAINAVYAFLNRSADFFDAIQRIDLHASSPDELVDRYADRLYRIDQLHRQCLGAYRAAESPGALTPIVDRIDGVYVHQFLQPLAESWDTVRATPYGSASDSVQSQRRFFNRVVGPFLKRGDKVVVIISDALRYEVGKELEERVAAVNRLSAATTAMLAAAPTTTAMGMNALLPHDTLSVRADGSVLIDGRSVAGIKGRSSFLAEAIPRMYPGKRADAFWARDIVELPAAAARERIRGLDAVCLYSDRIDAIGDDPKTETALPDAVETELSLLTKVIKKFASQLNRTHIVVTADHGFIFQNSAAEDTHLIAAEKPSDGYKDRRYLTGSKNPGAHFRKYAPEELGFDAPHPFYFADGLYRVRKQGGGVRFVHGGVSLQELVIPLVQIHVGRSDSVRSVDVAILKPANPLITTHEHKVEFFQEDPICESVQPVTVRAGFVSMDGTPLSDTVELTFDSADKNAQNRAQSAVFHFAPSAVEYNGSTVLLRLEQVIGGIAVHYVDETYRYQTFGERDFE